MRNHQSQKMVREISNQYRNVDERTQGPSLLPQHSNEYSNVLQNVYSAEIHNGNTNRDDNPIGFLRLDASRFTPSINSICTSSSHSTSAINKVDGASKSFHESEVFELWKIVKDGLALHMLTDLCLESRLEPPPCLTSLLPDIKLKILEFLHGTDLARVGCVSSELKSLSSNNDLWKRIYKEEFSLPESGDLPKNHWKHEYIIAREKSKENRWFWPAYGNVQSFQDVVQWNRAPAWILYAPSI